MADPLNKQNHMKKSALIIGEFTKTEHGYTGIIETLAIKATLTFQPNDDKKESHPDHIVMRGTREIGAAWDKLDDAVVRQ